MIFPLMVGEGRIVPIPPNNGGNLVGSILCDISFHEQFKDFLLDLVNFDFIPVLRLLPFLDDFA